MRAFRPTLRCVAAGLCILALMALAACNRGYYAPGKTDDQVQADYAACKQGAEQQVQNGNPLAVDDIIQSCMEAKGYRNSLTD